MAHKINTSLPSALFAFLGIVITLYPELALAQTAVISPSGTTVINVGGVTGLGFDLCDNINAIFYGNLAKGIATLGVIGIGLYSMFGKVTWGMAVLTAVGIAGMFGAGALAQSFGGGC